MNTSFRSLCSIIAAAGLACAAAVAQPTKPADTKPSTTPAKPAQPEKPKTPPTGEKPAPPAGMPSPEDMAKYEAAAKPGKMHQHLMKDVGTWDGKVKMWQAAGTEPQESVCTTVMTSMFEGRFLKDETQGDLPGMGAFKGFGLYGYDNVSEKFQSVWVDNAGTGISTGTGTLSADGKVLTWTMTMNDPLTKKAMTMREVDRHITDDNVVLEMYMPGKDGKEFKMMEINYTRKGGAKTQAEPPKAPAEAPKPAPPKK